MKRCWWKEAVAYQVYPRSFKDSNGDGNGDLRGIIEKLDYLKELGIDLIWLCPIYASPNDDNGYDISDYEAILPMYGTMTDFDCLLEEIHKRGMKLILDLVINHTSDEHQWFIESRSSRSSSKRDWYIWREPKQDGSEPNNWESIFHGSAWEYDRHTGDYYLHLFSKKQPDLNWENEKVRQALYQMIDGWLAKGIDGFRVDAISHIKKADGLPDLPNPKGLRYVPSFAGHLNQKGIERFLQELKQRTFANYDIVTVGEANGVSAEEAGLWVGEADGVFNMIFQFEHLGLWGNDGRPFDLKKVKQVLSTWQEKLDGVGWNALFLENHDQPRSVSSWGNDEQYWRESATALATVFFFMQGTPFIYQGQEIGMTNVRFSSIDEYRDVSAKNEYRLKREEGLTNDEALAVIWTNGRDNARTPMQWDDSAHAGFSTADKTWIGVNPNYRSINVAAQERDVGSVLSYYKAMIRLRKGALPLIYGRYVLEAKDDPAIYAYRRVLQGQSYLIIVNMVASDSQLEAGLAAQLKKMELLLSNQQVSSHAWFRPYEARVYKEQEKGVRDLNP
ncbi:alpha-glucosidase [Alkalihalobacillus oceani]|uniref:alpha-glucosidase n=1 Tax=Halalkalibacter oceani TaxID=1653776 RepID=UPI00203A7124|nr:alpha-glucosidase [Halalkalibacter oceani]MCM3759982.1 alpha-glucosidase [Halalkalibacter oceani]